jgi:hypothetical protein
LELARRIDHLHSFPIDRLESGAQAFVSTDQLGQTSLQRLDLESPLQTVGGRHVVGRAHQTELLQKPEPLLRK